ncbi:MAG: hypothetical protein ACJ8C0_02830 [Microvirga sp.]
MRVLAAAIVLALAAVVGRQAVAAEPPLAAPTLVGPPEIVFASTKDACDGHDVPDAPVRAFRDAKGAVVLFGMHYQNRALRGESFDKLKLDCRIVLASSGKADPAAYDDKSWITATWTEDGTRVEALLHHEYQANHHAGRCKAKEYLACWYNTVLAVASSDGGASFPRPKTPQVVAAAPFRQEVGQGRHRGFFNPSNIVTDGALRYMFAATTGWDGQPSGACLFRTADVADGSAWRAWDGEQFSVRYADPYRSHDKPARACRPIEPFPAPVGAVVRHRPSGAWIAVFQAAADGGRFPEPGFYYAASRDLVAWDKPRLLIAGKTLYDSPCGASELIAYPSLLDREANGRNFDDVGDAAELYFATLRIEGCAVTSDRNLVRRKVAIKVWPYAAVAVIRTPVSRGGRERPRSSCRRRRRARRRSSAR